MGFPEWVRSQPRGVLTRISRETGLSYTLIHDAYRGRAIGLYETAKKIAAATNGAVTIEELCDPPKPPKAA